MSCDENDATYYHYRLMQTLILAKRASNPSIRAIHVKMAEMYVRLADEADDRRDSLHRTGMIVRNHHVA